MNIKRLVVLSAVAVSFVASLAACSIDHLLNGDPPPQGSTANPDLVASYAGAVQLYYGSINAMALGISNASQDVGAFTDELNSAAYGGADVDARVHYMNSGDNTLITSGAYSSLQATRVQAAQASELLLRYGTAAARPLIGHAYALQAHAITLLAELFCSGVPLTTAPFQNDFKYTAGFSTTDLLNRAVALFDTAYSYGKDSLPIATFARVGKGRALLDLGRYADAASAVDEVPTSAQYVVEFAPSGAIFWADPVTNANWRVLSQKGGNGIRWTENDASLQDPRVPVTTDDEHHYTNPVYQTKYTDVANVVVADGIQARLIEAEAQLQPAEQPSGPWLATLNSARATIGLPALPDPGTAAGRVDLLFRERALWFYLNGQRLGDMRRLVRFYQRPAVQVYPSGRYDGNNSVWPSYGNQFVFATPSQEQNLNPLYKGCIDVAP